MLGPAADLTEQINKAEAERDEAKEKLHQQEDSVNEYTDSSNPKSPKYCLQTINNALRGDDNWAGRDRKIHNNRANTSVRDDTYKQFVRLEPSKSRTELTAEYTKKIKELNETRTADAITRSIPSFPKDFDSYDDTVISVLLAQKIERPELSNREKRLFELVQQGKTTELSDRLIYLKLKSSTECPYCFQPLPEEHKASLVASIEKVLSKAVEEHQKSLRKYVYGEIFQDVEKEFASFEMLKSCQKCIMLANQINKFVQNNNDLLKKKNDNPYEPINSSISNVHELVEQLKDALTELEREKTEYNNITKRVGLMISDLVNINSEIAYYDIKELVTQYEKQNTDYASVKQIYSALESDYENKKRKVEDLEAQRRNIRLALDTINACFNYIFFDDNRLKIDSVDGVYKLFSHGRSVKPCDVSAGERNIIGLSYFFTSIFEGKEEREAYKEEYILVIDDPVSSYDTENKIGILSFLKYKLSAFLEENQYTKALVMTHDLMTFYDIHKMFEEIIASCKKKEYQSAPKFNRFELRDNALINFSYNKRQEYSEILKIIYRYASGTDTEHEIVIGNLMRQALEAFSTFEYKTGIETVSTDPEILKILPQEDRIYYKNLMYRLVLHGGSHREEQVKTMQDFRFFGLISEAEKQRTAKDILCFIYLLNPKHLLSHLADEQNKESTIKREIEQWCQDIKVKAAVM